MRSVTCCWCVNQLRTIISPYFPRREISRVRARTDVCPQLFVFHEALTSAILWLISRCLSGTQANTSGVVFAFWEEQIHLFPITLKFVNPLTSRGLHCQVSHRCHTGAWWMAVPHALSTCLLHNQLFTPSKGRAVSRLCKSMDAERWWLTTSRSHGAEVNISLLTTRHINSGYSAASFHKSQSWQQWQDECRLPAEHKLLNKHTNINSSNKHNHHDRPLFHSFPWHW